MTNLPRLPRFLAAGLLLFAAVFLLTALLAQPPYASVGVTAAAVFLPLWYALSVVNAWIGVVSAGFPLAAEVPVFGLVFGVPAAVAGLGWWASTVYWDGGPLIHTGRAPAVLAAGLALWGAVLILAGLLAGAPSLAASTGPTAAVFVPLWLLLCLVNLAVGVRAAGYTVLEEIPVFLLNAAVPVAVAVAAWRLAEGRRRHRRSGAGGGAQ